MLNDLTSYALVVGFLVLFSFFFSMNALFGLRLGEEKKLHPHRTLHSAAGELTGPF